MTHIGAICLNINRDIEMQEIFVAEMRRETRQFRSDDFTIHLFWGDVTVDDFLGAVEDFAKKGVTRLVLWDFEAATSMAVHVSDVEKAVQMTANAGYPDESRAALFAPDLTTFGITRQAEAYFDMADLKIAVRASRKWWDAMQWLSGKSDVSDGGLGDARN